ncbi:hypothetical protein DV451_000271 [Geotrichum candidum]|uniref:PH-response regulator protein palI/RIM9 n=1 Tax=Geotrichum candidum TaxID=1173061 RepID=A0A9P5GC08_GEOCN|nr:hypothetical protein DV451_000271 [Geotrichum candidum]
MGIRIRPASGLTVVLLAALALQVISVISVPVARGISLGSVNNMQYGVLGYCDTAADTCTYSGIGYDNDIINADEDDFKMSSSARHTLSTLLITHIVAAGLTLLLLVFTVIAHFHAPANSSKYLIVMILLTIPTFLVSLLAFLVDLLLFLPHLNWGAWIMVGATALISFYFILLLVMKRALAKKKAHKRALKDTSDLENLNENNFFGNDMAYGGDNSLSYNPVSHEMSKYEPVVVTESIGGHENTSFKDTNEKAGVPHTASPFEAASAPLVYNRYQHTPSPSDHFRNTNTIDRKGTASPYQHYDSRTNLTIPSYESQPPLDNSNPIDNTTNNNNQNDLKTNRLVAGTYDDIDNPSLLHNDTYNRSNHNNYNGGNGSSANLLENTSSTVPSHSHPYSSYESQSNEYQPPVPKWSQQQPQPQRMSSSGPPAQNYPPTTAFKDQHLSLRQDHLNMEDNGNNFYSNTQPQSPPSQKPQMHQPRQQQQQQQQQQNFYQPPPPQPAEIFSPARHKSPQATDLMLNNNPDFELPSKRNLPAKRNKPPSTLRPGFGNLDGPYGASRGF